MMENQRPAKRRDEKVDEDRISKLPQHILHHHILSLLPQDDAVRTCILSKSWRHLGPTRPKIEFREISFPETKEKFHSVVENTLQRYVDQKLPIQEFILETRGHYLSSKPCLVLTEKMVNLLVLKHLELHFINIDDETFKKIMSRCPLIQHVVLDYCRGLSAVKVNKARHLKHLDFSGPYEIDSIEINDDAPSLETVSITKCRNWYLNNNNNYFFPRLKSLYLWHVHLPTELLNNLSTNNCPCLEELQLQYCSGFTKFKLSSRSIKSLIINISDTSPIEVAIIDAANMLYFELSGFYLPTISLKTTSREWKSHIKACRRSFSNADVSSSTWYLKLHEFLKALSLSQISLDISYLPLTYQDTNNDDGDGGSCEPVVVEHLCLRDNYSSYQLRLLLNCVFRICRPRYIGLSLYYSQKIHESQLVNKGETRQCNFWQQDFGIQVPDENTNEWRDVQACAFSNNQSIRFRLKWRYF